MTAAPKRVSREVYKVGRELAKWNELSAIIENVDGIDPETLLDTLEGETDLHEAIAAVGERVLEFEAFAAGCAEAIKAMAERKARFDRDAVTLKNLMLTAMDSAGIDKITAPAFTLSARKTPPKPVILDEEKVPARFWKRADPRIDKAAINEAVKNGEEVEGVALDNGGLSLTMRKK